MALSGEPSRLGETSREGKRWFTAVVDPGSEEMSFAFLAPCPTLKKSRGTGWYSKVELAIVVPVTISSEIVTGHRLTHF